MRQTILGILAGIGMMAASAMPASACGGCSGCGYASPCATAPVQPYWDYERLPDPELQYHSAPRPMPQYYYVNQGPTFSGPGAFAPYPTYDQGHGYWHHRHHWHPHGSHPPVLHSLY